MSFRLPDWYDEEVKIFIQRWFGGRKKMGDMIKAIHDDMDEYERRCKKYGEEPVRAADGYLDCYGDHAKSLESRERKENEA